MLPFSAWRTAIRLHETASGFSATVGPTTHRPSIVLYAYGPSSWLGITSNGWRASTQFAPNPHLCCHFLQENLIFFPNIATVLAWLVLLFHFCPQVFPLLYMMMVVYWPISVLILIYVLVPSIPRSFINLLIENVPWLHASNIANMTSLFDFSCCILTGTTHILKTVRSPV